MDNGIVAFQNLAPPPQRKIKETSVQLHFEVSDHGEHWESIRERLDPCKIQRT
jgi:hypothetical protein